MTSPDLSSVCLELTLLNLSPTFWYFEEWLPIPTDNAILSYVSCVASEPILQNVSKRPSSCAAAIHFCLPFVYNTHSLTHVHTPMSWHWPLYVKGKFFLLIRISHPSCTQEKWWGILFIIYPLHIYSKHSFKSLLIFSLDIFLKEVISTT